LKEVAFGQGPAEDFTVILTANMSFPLNFLTPCLAAVDSSVGADNLTEAQLIARYPAIAVTGALLLSLGLICNLYLLFRFTRRPTPGQGSTQEPLLKIEPQSWGMNELMFATVALILIWTVVDGTFMLALKLTHMDVEDDRVMPWLLTTEMVIRVSVLLGFIGFFRWRRVDWRRALGLRGISPAKSIGFGALCFFAILPPLAITFLAYSRFCQLVGIKEKPQDIADILASSDSMAVVVLIAVFAIMVAPVFEEFFFRGFAYPVLKQRWGTWRALMTVSAVFAAIHFHLPSFGPLFALGFGLGLAYELSGSLLAPITMHALFNAINVAMLLYVRAHS
jgi:membrane protease YdiL (CAAX protease family)